MNYREKIYERINNTIIDKLNSGVIPWKNNMNSFLPSNFISSKWYQGINWLLLNHLNFKSPFYLTFLQTQQKGGQILKGSKGFPVVFWKIMTAQEPNETGSYDQFPLIRISTVFNLSQTSLYDDSKEKELLKAQPTAQSILSDIVEKHNPVIDNNFRGQGFYRPATHSICIPPIDQFSNPNSYYEVIFHELIHWTGKELKREASNDHSTKEYAFEELIAEIGSSYLCSICGIESEIENQASYIQSWLKRFEDDNTFIIKASTHAKKAVNHLLSNSAAVPA